LGKIILTNGNIITPYRFLKDYTAVVENKKIYGIIRSNDIVCSDGDRVIDVHGCNITPGFIDMHLHGGGGADVMEGTVEDFTGIAEFHMKHGTTAMVPTTNCAPLSRIFEILDVFRKAKRQKSGAKLLGIHLEGPFISPCQSGAMNADLIKLPSKEDIEKILSYKDIVLRVTAAPEMEGVPDLARRLREHGIMVSTGHSDAAYDDMLKALESGFTHITHFYSAMSTVKRVNAYRISGVIESAYLLDGYTVEVIADGHHLPADLLKLIYKSKGPEKTALVTDCIFAAGIPEGSRLMGSSGKEIIVEGGVAKLLDRSAFAGSISTMDVLVKNMVRQADVPLIEAVKMASATPARLLGLGNKKGVLDKGMDADIVVMDPDFDVKLTMVEGNILYNKLD